MTVRWSHFGICVSDLERSVRFYTDGLGYEVAERHEIGEAFGRLVELEGCAFQSQMLRRDGQTVELLHFDEPAPVGRAERRPMNQLGLTHLSFRVDDVDETAAVLEALGATRIDSTRTVFGEGDGRLDFVYLTDPDGVRIELMRLPG